MRRPPHLPFMDGPPEFAPGLQLIPAGSWLCPDSEAEDWLAGKRDLMRTRREDVFANTGETDSLEEVAGLVSAHVDARLPSDWPTPLEAAAALVSDDLCIMRRAEGAWHLVAASLCAPSYWRLSEYLGRPLAGLHRPVEGRDGALAARIARIFDMMRPGQIFERFNWTVQTGPERFTPRRPRTSDITADSLFLRVERQTIRKLEHTGTVLFTIRICLDPLAAVLGDADNAAAFRQAWCGASQEVRDYKGWAVLDAAVEVLLEAGA